MKEPIREYCRLGLVHFMAYPACLKGEGPIVETVAQIARDPDFEVLEIGPIIDAGVRREVVAIAQQSRLALAFAAQGADVVISYLDEHEDAQTTATLLEKTGRRSL